MRICKNRSMYSCCFVVVGMAAVIAAVVVWCITCRAQLIYLQYFWLCFYATIELKAHLHQLIFEDSSKIQGKATMIHYCLYKNFLNQQFSCQKTKRVLMHLKNCEENNRVAICIMSAISLVSFFLSSHSIQNDIKFGQTICLYCSAQKSALCPKRQSWGHFGLVSQDSK